MKNTKGLEVLTADIFSLNLALDVSKIDFMTLPHSLLVMSDCEDDLMNLSSTSAMSVGY